MNGNVEILVNDKTARKLTLTAENNELLRQFVFQEIESSTTNSVELRFDGKGMLGYRSPGNTSSPGRKNPSEKPSPSTSSLMTAPNSPKMT